MPGERFFSSGNERAPTTFGPPMYPNDGVKAAFPLAADNNLYMEYELMNMADVDQDVYVTIDYEYHPRNLPRGFKTTKAFWLDITDCGFSSVTPPSGETKFKLSSSPSTSDYDGVLQGVGGHLHDRGLNVGIY
jgi:hypothetical protein